MDILERAAIHRATAALGMIADTGLADRAQAFKELAFAVLLGKGGSGVVQALARHPNPLVQKASANFLDSNWSHGDAATLAAGYIASIAENSLLDQIKKYAKSLPPDIGGALVASGWLASVTPESEAKVVKHQGLSFGAAEPQKCAAIVVLSDMLARAIGGEGQKLFEVELASAVTRATNESVLALLTNTSATEVAGSGNPLTDLRAGLHAAGPSTGYVVAASTGDTAWLATSEANRGGMGIRGGSFVPGVDVVAVDELAGLRIIPASRLTLYDQGLSVRSSGQASVNMADSPTSPSTQVSLWQTDCLGLIAERLFHLVTGDAKLVIVGGA